MADPAAFAFHRAQPTAGPGVEPTESEAAPPRRRVGRQQPAEPAAREEASGEPLLPLSDVLTLLAAPQALQAVKLFAEMDVPSGRMALTVIHRLWPHLFK